MWPLRVGVNIGGTPEAGGPGTYCIASVPNKVSGFFWLLSCLSCQCPLFFTPCSLFSATPKHPFSFLMLSTPLSFLFSASSWVTYWHVYWALRRQARPGEAKVYRTLVWAIKLNPRVEIVILFQWARTCPISQRCLHFKRGWYLSPRNKSRDRNFRFQT